MRNLMGPACRIDAEFTSWINALADVASTPSASAWWLWNHHQQFHSACRCAGLKRQKFCHPVSKPTFNMAVNLLNSQRHDQQVASRLTIRAMEANESPGRLGSVDGYVGCKVLTDTNKQLIESLATKDYACMRLEFGKRTNDANSSTRWLHA